MSAAPRLKARIVLIGDDGGHLEFAGLVRLKLAREGREE